jgi:hypothetical protein
MTKTFKLSKPLNHAAEVRKANKECIEADKLCEFAHMRAYEVFSVHKFNKGGSETATRRLDAATEALSNAREQLGIASYQLEHLLKETGN